MPYPTCPSCGRLYHLNIRDKEQLKRFNEGKMTPRELECPDCWAKRQKKRS